MWKDSATPTNSRGRDIITKQKIFSFPLPRVLAWAENVRMLDREKSTRPTKSIPYNRTVLPYLILIKLKIAI